MKHEVTEYESKGFTCTVASDSIWFTVYAASGACAGTVQWTKKGWFAHWTDGEGESRKAACVNSKAAFHRVVLAAIRKPMEAFRAASRPMGA
jgi:hypothetical protein